MKNHAPTLLLAVGIALFTGSSRAMCASLKVHGSATVYEMLLGSRRAEIEKESGLSLEVLSMGSGKGMESLAAGSCDVAMISSPLAEVAEKLNAKKAGTINVSDYQSVDVAKSQVLFIANPSVGVQQLNLEQLKGLFAGKISDWKEVGGKSEPVMVVTPIVGHGVRVAVEHGLLAGAEIAKDARIQQGSPQVLNAVSQLPGSIGFVGQGNSALPASVKQLSTDRPLPMTLSLVTKGAPTADVARLIQACKTVGSK